MWNRAAGVQFLRLGLSLFEQKVFVIYFDSYCLELWYE